MLLFIKNFLIDCYNSFDNFLVIHRTKLVLGLIGVIALMLIFGCAAAPGEKFSHIKGNGYCYWEDAPEWVAADFIGEGWGLLDGRQFIGDGGQMCYAVKVDKPVTDGECDIVAVVCESGSFDDRHGPNTPLVIPVGSGPCDSWDKIVEAINNLKEKA